MSDDDNGLSPSAQGVSDADRGTSTAPHRLGPPSPEQLDARPTTSWAIGSAGSAGSFVVNLAIFDLLNRESGRAHQLHVPNLQLDVGIPIRLGKRTEYLPSAGAGVPEYVMFNTPRPMTFADFNGVRCRITSANMALFWGYSVTYLTIWRDAFYIGEQIAYVRMSGFGWAFLPSGSVGHGVGLLDRGSGHPLGEVNVPLILVPQEDDYVPEPPLVYMKLDAREDRPIELPGDLLFNFDSAEIRPDAVRPLTYLADLLNNRRSYPVTIEGHTDSTGGQAYNRTLSIRRAAAVKGWLIGRSVLGAATFRVVGFGESRPKVPEDDADARAQNRRVVVNAEWNLVVP